METGTVSSSLVSLQDLRRSADLQAQFAERGSYRQSLLDRYDEIVASRQSGNDSATQTPEVAAERRNNDEPADATPGVDFSATADGISRALDELIGDGFRETLSDTARERLTILLENLPSILASMYGEDDDGGDDSQDFSDLRSVMDRSAQTLSENGGEETSGSSIDFAPLFSGLNGSDPDTEETAAETRDGSETAEESGSNNGPEEGGAPSGSDPDNEEIDFEGLNAELREAMVVNAEENPDGIGRFTDEKIANTIGENDYWENTGDSMKVQDGVKPSEAVANIFENPGDYTHECASSVVALSLKAQLDVLGPERFDEVYADGLTLNAWDNAAIEGSEIYREAQPGEFEVAGESTVEGDLQPFDPSQGDELIEGDIYYFDKAGDSSSYYQGWNVVYLGENDDGTQRFWTMEGIEDVTLTEEDGVMMPEEDNSLLSGYYLAASRTDPNGGFFV